jgi:uncharacterized protein YceH (UPF0502 family)
VAQELQELSNRETESIVVDLERLEAQAQYLYLHRFIEAVKKARGEHGRYLKLRAGDELAIAAANDGSAELVGEIKVEVDLTADETSG